MSQSQSLNNMLDSLFRDPTLTQDLSSEEQEAMKAFVGELMDGIAQLSQNSTSSEVINFASTAASIDPSVMPEFDALISEPEIGAGDALEDDLMGQLLNQQSDMTLISLLDDHIDAASHLIEILNQRPIGKQELDVIRRVELQLVAVSLFVGDLRRASEKIRAGCKLSHRPLWINCLKSLLLHEFHFINDWLR